MTRIEEKDIEMMEASLEAQREAMAEGRLNGPAVSSIGDVSRLRGATGPMRRIQPPRPMFYRGGDSLEIIPEELVDLVSGEATVRKIRLECTQPSGCQIRTVSFEKPTKLTEDGLFVMSQPTRGRGRLKEVWNAVNPWKLMSGRKDDIIVQKALGIKSR